MIEDLFLFLDHALDDCETSLVLGERYAALCKALRESDLPQDVLSEIYDNLRQNYETCWFNLMNAWGIVKWAPVPKSLQDDKSAVLLLVLLIVLSREVQNVRSEP